MNGAAVRRPLRADEPLTSEVSVETVALHVALERQMALGDFEVSDAGHGERSASVAGCGDKGVRCVRGVRCRGRVRSIWRTICAMCAMCAKCARCARWDHSAPFGVGISGGTRIARPSSMKRWHTRHARHARHVTLLWVSS